MALRRDGDAPGCATNWDRLDRLAALKIDHGYIARIAVGRVKALAVWRERDAPHPLAHEIVAVHLESLGVNLGNAVGGAERHVSPRPVGREREAAGLDQFARDTRQREANFSDHLARRGVQDRYSAAQLRCDPDLLAVRRKLRGTW